MPSGEAFVQRELLPAGQALVLPAPLAARCRTCLPHAERDAGTGRLGLRGSPYYEATQAVNPLDALAEQGRFAIVEGRMASLSESGGVLHVNFGRDEGTFVGASLTPKALAGRSVEVRGWIEERGGPAIEACAARAA